jgi:hypothetical protein
MKAYSRRKALKTLAATTGALTLTALPIRWETPVVEVGYLPVHAQTSAPMIANLTSQFAGINNCAMDAGSLLLISFMYTDPGNKITDATIIHYQYRFLPSGNSGDGFIILGDPTENIDHIGDTFTGTIAIPFCVIFVTATSLEITTYITNGDGVNSNAMTIIVSAPPGANDTGQSDEQGQTIKKVPISYLSD